MRFLLSTTDFLDDLRVRDGLSVSPIAEVAGVDSLEFLTLKSGEAVTDAVVTDADVSLRVVRRGRGGMLVVRNRPGG